MLTSLPHNGNIHGGDTRKERGAIAMNGVQHILRFKAWLQNHGRCTQHRKVHAHGQAISMKEWCDAQHNLCTLARLWRPVPRLHSVGDQIAMSQHCTLRKACGAARILQHSQIVPMREHWQIEEFDAASGMGCQHSAHHMESCIAVNLFIGQRRLGKPGAAQSEWIEGMQERREIIGRAGYYYML